MKKINNYICIIYLFLLCVTSSFVQGNVPRIISLPHSVIDSKSASASPPGDVISDAIDAGTLSNNNSFTHTVNLSSNNGYTDDDGQFGLEVYYKYTITETCLVTMSNCGSTVPTSLRWGNVDQDWDDGGVINGPACPGEAVSFSMEMGPGTYYLAIDLLDNNNQGNVTTTITVEELPVDTDCNQSPVGDKIDMAIDAGTLSINGTFTHTVNLSSDSCYQDNNGQFGLDVYYKFTLVDTALVTISNCGSAVPTSLRWGNFYENWNAVGIINGPACPAEAVSFSMEMGPGTYYLAIDLLDNNNQGNVTTKIALEEVEPEIPTIVCDSIIASQDQNYVITYIPREAGLITSAAVATASCDPEKVQTSIQYYDGLGRALQSVQVKGSPDKKDIVIPIAYDAFGREAKKYLPYASSFTNGAYKADALTQVIDYYNTPQAGHASTFNTPFSETRFEPSPLNRVLEQGAPGGVWQIGSHTQKIDYGTNVTNEVKLWVVTTDGADGTGVYLPGKLYKTISKDENWTESSGKAGITEEFKDLEGRVVLKRIWETDTKGLSTYYVYDDFGNLRYVLTPAVNENGQNPVNSFAEADDAFKHFMYGYHYDGRKRLVEKKIPGKGWEHLVYNKLDQLVLSQDALQRANGKWLFTKYDALGRVVVTGLYADASSRTVLADTVNNQTVLWENRVATGIGYDNGSFPRTTAYYHTINYYDDYDFPGNTFPQPDGITQMQAARVKGLQTGGFVYLTESSTKFLSVNYYDKDGRLIRSASENHLGGTDLTDNSWNFAGELTASTRTHTASPTGPATTVATRYKYDHMGRKLATMESINGQAEVVLSKLTYNKVGQLLKKQLHSTDGSNFLQFTDYAYNERGWLKTGISDQFSLRLKYNDGTVPQYNGNIANQEWGAGVNFPNIFTYDYDKLNRLLKGATADIAMSEELSYDEMGNIKTLNRGGAGISTYSYSGNQLINVIGGSVMTGNYIHDVNGNVTTDGRTGAALTYNHLNLPVSATRPDLSIAYTYDATGNKLKKVSSTEATSDYVNGIQYTGGNIDFIMTEEGKARKNGSGIYSYEYNLNDHLGNARYTFNQKPGVFEIQMLQENNYYAFGKPVGGTALNKYLYNGKELQEELGQFDYGARFYDPVIGRWNVIDPLAELDRMTTPYAYGFNDPIRHTDPDGMFGEDVNEDFDQEDGPGKGAKVAAGAAITTTPGVGSIVLEGLKDIGSGLSQTVKFGISATAAAVSGTIALVFLPTEAGKGSDKPPRPILPPPLVPPDLLKNSQDNASASKPNQKKKENRRADAEHTSNQQEKNRNKHEDARARKDREQAKADEKYNNTKSTKKDTRSNNQKKKDDPNYKRTGPKTE